MDQIITSVINKIRCPICQFQIKDGTPDVMESRFNFCCENYSYHYRLWIPFNGIDSPKIQYDNLFICDEQKYQFIIDQRYLANITTIKMYSMYTYHLDRIYAKFKYNQIMFDYSNLNYNKILNKIKMILLYQ